MRSSWYPVRGRPPAVPAGGSWAEPYAATMYLHNYVSPLVDACPPSTTLRLNAILAGAQIVFYVCLVSAVVVVALLGTRRHRHRASS